MAKRAQSAFNLAPQLEAADQRLWCSFSFLYVGYQALIPLSASVIHKLLLLTLANECSLLFVGVVDRRFGEKRKRKKEKKVEGMDVRHVRGGAARWRVDSGLSGWQLSFAT